MTSQYRSRLNHHLVLQPHLDSETSGAPFDMEAFSPGLMSPAPL